MDSELKKIFDLLSVMDSKLNNVEKRLTHLEKVDSIEHRVTVNQIDISDIKELLQKLEAHPEDQFTSIVKEAMSKFEDIYLKHVDTINRRLDSQLLKIAKAEEEIQMLR
ncbi:hypothetical protein ACFYKX_03260 [Cytobacillus sp. FJAT-54145]|uniref:Uncharacterized protein n=1 Tax=Cytobacillus spartinae TaxID=3299023 RepID=A0ABW6KA06_9BACI